MTLSHGTPPCRVHVRGHGNAASSARGALVLSLGGAVDGTGQHGPQHRRGSQPVGRAACRCAGRPAGSSASIPTRASGTTPTCDEAHQLTLERFAPSHPGEFDVAMSVFVLEHVADPESFVDACAHVLRPAGPVVRADRAQVPLLRHVHLGHHPAARGGPAARAPQGARRGGPLPLPHRVPDEHHDADLPPAGAVAGFDVGRVPHVRQARPLRVVPARQAQAGRPGLDQAGLRTQRAPPDGHAQLLRHPLRPSQTRDQTKTATARASSPSCS